jgi:acyl-CoA dehydrogenase
VFDTSYTEEQQALVETARRFAREEMIPVAARHDVDGSFPWEVIKKAHQVGLMNLEIPEPWGPGLGVLESCLVVEELSYGCAGMATSIMANTLASTPVILAGTDEQKSHYLGMLMSEPVLASYAVTEPAAGSDVAAMMTNARKVGDEYVLNGSKVFITNARHARWFTVFATHDKALRHKGISGFVIPADRPGVKIGKHEDKMGQRSSDTSEVVFEDVKLTRKDLLGAEGEGFKLAMRTFDRTRPPIGAIAAGVMHRALDESVAYSKQRVTFGVPIAQHQAIQGMLADMAVSLEATRLLTHKAAASIDKGAGASIVSSYAKLYGSEAAMRVTTDAVQIFGGYGYMRDYPVEKLMRDAKLLQIYEGTSQIQRMVIARHVLQP